MKCLLQRDSNFTIAQIIPFLLFFLTAGTAAAQDRQYQYVIPWGKAVETQVNGQQMRVPFIEGQAIDGITPNFSVLEPLNPNSRYEVELVGFTTAGATNEDLQYLDRWSLSVPDEPQYTLQASRARDEQFLALHLFPYVRQGGTVRRIASVQVEQRDLGKMPKKILQKDFANSSVLQTGYWYRVAVSETGIYKLDKAYLEACGVDVDNIDPMSIHVFGNADGRLPELNSAPRTDDLAQNAIRYVGLADGSFDEEDYILFHGWSPHRWYPGIISGFTQDRNIYSDKAFYFINVDPSRAPLIMQTLPDPAGSANISVNSYSYYDVHEEDIQNLVKGGQRWYGELFDVDLTRTFAFQVPDIVPGNTAEFAISLAANGNVGDNFVVTAGGSVIGTQNLPSASSDYSRTATSFTATNLPENIYLQIQVNRGQPDVLTYLDKIELNTRRQLAFTGSGFHFRDRNSVGAGNIASFTISGTPAGAQVWDVTDRHRPFLINSSDLGGSLAFEQATDSLREFLVTDNETFLTPSRVAVVANQDLHGLEQCDYLIVTHPLFTAQANRLADLHRSEGLKVNVVTTQQVFNEFSSGANDPTAIRTLAKMFYDRGGVAPGPTISNLLLFGDGTYDPKNRLPDNNYFVPVYEALNSENMIAALVSDDYYALLDDSDAFSPSNMQDIGVGRLLISDNTMAREQVDKIEHYMKNGSSLFINQDANTQGNTSTFGDWRLKYVQIADDEQGGEFVTDDTEPQSQYVRQNYPEYNATKLYMDAYTQISTAGGHRYPDIFEAITRNVERGALIVNYSGHGGEVGLAEERVITVPQIQSWKNANNFPLLVSATCEFTRYDDPSRVSAGEWASINSVGGAIALMTTTRPVYIDQNTIIGLSFFQTVFLRDAQNEPLTFGEIIRRTKNNAGTQDNRRVFTLIGDPALKLAMPRLQVKLDSVNGVNVLVESDTIRALSTVTMSGHIEDNNGNILTNFSGVLSPSVYDKPKTVTTLGQDPNSPVIPFRVQENIIYRGKATITNGYFQFKFVVPKDINYQYGHGKVSLYGNSAVTDARGMDTSVIIGGIDPNGIADNVGPQIELYLNDETFVNGSLTDETPILLANIYDDNGINTVGNGVGHDITAIIDAESSKPIVLNDFYIADLDSYQSGKIRYNMSKLEQGKHTLTLKVWDVNNNSAEKTIEFIVQAKEELALEHVLNYPNPFTTHTEFYFEHNQVLSSLEVQIQIFTVSGRLVKTINQLVNTQGFRSPGITWDGRDDFGDQLAKGVYVYRLSVRTPDGDTDEKLEKLVLLK